MVKLLNPYKRFEVQMLDNDIDAPRVQLSFFDADNTGEESELDVDKIWLFNSSNEKQKAYLSGSTIHVHSSGSGFANDIFLEFFDTKNCNTIINVLPSLPTYAKVTQFNEREEIISASLRKGLFGKHKHKKRVALLNNQKDLPGVIINRKRRGMRLRSIDQLVELPSMRSTHKLLFDRFGQQISETPSLKQAYLKIPYIQEGRFKFLR